MATKFFERFVSLCDRNGETPNYVGKVVGVSSGSVTGWKNGRIPHGYTVEKIAEHFNVTVDYLMGKEPTSNQINRTLVERAGLLSAVKNIPLAVVEAKAELKAGEIKDWEFQQKTPDFNVLADVAEALGTSVPYLMGTTSDPAPLPTGAESDDSKKKQPSKEKALTQTGERRLAEEVAMVVEAYLNANEEQRAAILTLLTRK